MNFKGRTFQLWEYRVSHGMMLVRSPKGPDGPKTNMDIIFWDVAYVDLPRFLPDPVIETPTPEDMAEVERRFGRPPKEDSVAVLKSGGHRHLVVSGGYKIAENDDDIFHSPFDAE